jgi:hypothetical protein
MLLGNVCLQMSAVAPVSCTAQRYDGKRSSTTEAAGHWQALGAAAQPARSLRSISLLASICYPRLEHITLHYITCHSSSGQSSREQTQTG